MSFPIKNTFKAGAVNTDSSPEYVPSDMLTSANNVDMLSAGDDFVITPSKGNIRLGGRLSKGESRYIGYTTWRNLIYLFYTDASNGDYIIEYDTIQDVFTTVVIGDLGFPEYDDANIKRYVLSADVVDGRFLYWTLGYREADGELSGSGEPKRLHISDAKANPTTYSNFSGNYDKPNKPEVISGYSSQIKNNQLKHGSYIFYKRYITKYDERTVLSYPSDNIDVSVGFGGDNTTNYIQIQGFTVDDDVVSVEVLVSRDSSNTFSIIKTVDTTTDKNVSFIVFTNSDLYSVLDANSSSVINNQFPLTATEQTVADNVLVLGDVEIDYKYQDGDGNDLKKSQEFQYTATGITSGSTNVVAKAYDTTGSLSIVYAFVVGETYLFTINGYKYNTITTGYDPYVYTFNWTYSSGTTTADSGLAYAFISANSSFIITPVSSVASFTVTGLNLGQSSLNGLTSITVDNVAEGNARGLNTDFVRKGGIVWLDDKGRNVGVTNITDILYDGDEWTYNVKPNISASSITPPYWATRYMFVRDKVDTQLSYSVLGVAQTAAKSGFKVIDVDTQFYTDYISGYRGKSIVVFSKYLQRDVEVTVLTDQDKADEVTGGNTMKEGVDYVYFSDELTLTAGSLILFDPVKEVDTDSEIFYETSDVFFVTYDGLGNPTFSGDVVDKLNWYDTAVGEYDGNPYVIMKTDIESLRDINHLGRGAYTVQQSSDIIGNTTLVHSQKYDPSSNYNGLSDFSSYYGNYKDLERSYGSVELLHYDETNLLVGQKRKWSRVLINKDLVSMASGSGDLTTSTDYFNQVVTVPARYGITDKRSFDVNGYAKYFVDRNNGIFGRISQDGISVINGMRMDEIIQELYSHNPQDEIVGGFSPKRNEYIVALGDSRRIFRYSEDSKQQVGEHVLQDIPRDYIRVDTEMYTIAPYSNNELFEGSSVGENLYQEGDGSNCLFYSRWDVEQVVSLSVNAEPNNIKSYISTSINMETEGGYDTTNMEEGLFTFDLEIDTYKNYSTILGSDFDNREDVWYADFQRDQMSSTAPVYGVGNYKEASADPKEIVLESAPTNVSEGDYIFSGSGSPLGTVMSMSDNIITLESNSATTPSVGEIVWTQRSAKLNGQPIKGRYATITLTGGLGKLNATGYPDYTPDYRLYGITTNINLSSNTD